MADDVVKLEVDVNDDGSAGGAGQPPKQSARERREEHRLRLRELREDRLQRETRVRERREDWRQTRVRMEKERIRGRAAAGAGRAVASGAARMAGVSGLARVGGMVAGGVARAGMTGAAVAGIAGAGAVTGGVVLAGLAAVAVTATGALAGLAVAARGARDAVNFSPIAAGAQAQAEARETLGRFRRAQRIGPEAARFVDARSDIAEELRDIKGTITENFLPILNNILEVVALLAEGTSILVDKAFDQLNGLLEALGVKEAWNTFFEVFTDLAESVLDQIEEDRRKRYEEAIDIFKRFLNPGAPVAPFGEEDRVERNRLERELRDKLGVI